MGDDNFHGGAFLLAHNFSFYTRFGRAPRKEPGPDPSYPFSMGTPDAYSFYLGLGPLGTGTRKILDSATGPLWQEILTHPAYDDFWKARNVRPHLHDVKAAVLTVGGFYDTEDIHGPWWVYSGIEKLTPGADNHVVVGPWSHGGWSRGDDDMLGTLRWKYKTGPFFRDSVEYPFFAHNLAGAKIPITLPTDREVIEAGLTGVLPERARVALIRNTLTLDLLWVSEALLPTVAKTTTLEQVGEPWLLNFANGALIPPQL